MNLLTEWLPSSLFCFVITADVNSGAKVGTATHIIIDYYRKQKYFSLEENTGFTAHF